MVGQSETSGITYFAVHDIGIPPRFALPCFAAGCHVDHLKIATAALRPRNDTKLERFYLETDVSHFMRSFFARYRSAASFKHFVPKIVPFSRKTNQICHCEEGAILCARRGNLKQNDLPSRNEIWWGGTKQNSKMRLEETKQAASRTLQFTI